MKTKLNIFLIASLLFASITEIKSMEQDNEKKYMKSLLESFQEKINDIEEPKEWLKERKRYKNLTPNNQKIILQKIKDLSRMEKLLNSFKKHINEIEKPKKWLKALNRYENLSEKNKKIIQKRIQEEYQNKKNSEKNKNQPKIHNDYINHETEYDQSVHSLMEFGYSKKGAITIADSYFKHKILNQQPLNNNNNDLIIEIQPIEEKNVNIEEYNKFVYNLTNVGTSKEVAIKIADERFIHKFLNQHPLNNNNNDRIIEIQPIEEKNVNIEKYNQFVYNLIQFGTSKEVAITIADDHFKHKILNQQPLNNNNNDPIIEIQPNVQNNNINVNIEENTAYGQYFNNLRRLGLSEKDAITIADNHFFQEQILNQQPLNNNNNPIIEIQPNVQNNNINVKIEENIEKRISYIMERALEKINQESAVVQKKQIAPYKNLEKALANEEQGAHYFVCAFKKEGERREETDLFKEFVNIFKEQYGDITVTFEDAAKKIKGIEKELDQGKGNLCSHIHLTHNPHIVLRIALQMLVQVSNDNILRDLIIDQDANCGNGLASRIIMRLMPYLQKKK